jgi:deoxycytidylate deaminase
VNKDEKHLLLLRKIAETGQNRAKLAASIVIKNEIISIGTNRLKSHPLQAKFGKNRYCIYIHAEIDAIVKALKLIKPEELKKATLYVARTKQSRTGEQVSGLAKPCAGCMQAIASFGINKVIWSQE